ncbi:MAG: hypothetical protein ABSA59_21810 [Terriglobia bacterium]|jgi:hypothetical protein
MATNTEFVIVETPWARPSEEVIAKGRTLGGRLPAYTLLLEDSDFFKGKSIAELAREQGVGPVKDIRVFAGVIPADEDVDEMLAEIYRLREP